MLGRNHPKLGGVGGEDQVEKIVICYNLIDLAGPGRRNDGYEMLFGGDVVEGRGMVAGVRRLGRSRERRSLSARSTRRRS